MAGYDPKKAATYNKLRQQGLSEDAAATQAGITGDDQYSYVSGPNGTLGPQIDGGSKVAGVDYEKYTPAELKEQARFDQGLQSVDYDVKADSAPSSKTPINYTTTSTEQVSGGGSTTVTAGARRDNAASQALQPSISAKQAEMDQFNADNPSNFARKKQGLPPLTPEENLQRQQKLDQLTKEKASLVDQQADAKTPVEPTTTTVPNTTTTANTTTFSTSSENTDVQTPGGPDPAVNQQTDLQQAQSNTPAGSLTPIPAAVDNPQVQPVALVEVVATDAPAPVNETGAQPLLTPEQSIAQAQVTPTAVDPAAAAADFNANTNANVQEAIGVQAPAPVDPAANPGTQAAGIAFNQGNLGTRDPAAVEAAAQAAQEAQLRQQASVQAEFQSPGNNDWRVKLKLAPSATYLYKDTNAKNGILAPLAASNGVVFPYMPTIQTSYNAEYDSTDLTHSNYRGQFYKSSYVSDIQITGIFTAQDTAEANYLLAVIHFFRSVTKMFYGARDPLRGAPPPLVYLAGLGQYQFNNQPCVVKTFNYSMPNDCDYIRTKPNNYNVNLNDRQTKTQTGLNPIAAVIDRLRNAALPRGALPNVPAQSLLDTQSVYNIDNSTYVPTKCEIQITLMPIQTRNQQSKLFDMQGYASGKLLKGGFW